MEQTEKGISRLSVVPVRTSQSHQSELVTQLLFGDHYEIIESSEDNEWYKIRIHYDGYEGWIHRLNHYLISQEYFDQINNSDYKICTDHSANIFFKKNYIYIVIGSILPISTNELFRMEEQLAFNGKSKSLSQKRDFEFVKEISFKYLHAPYVWGGKTPFGIDCSGFTQQVFKISGYKLQRDSDKQANQGLLVDSLNESKPGDLAFFRGENGNISHVGIILGNNEFIHASGMVRIDKITEEGIVNQDTNKLTHHLAHIRRIIRYSP